VAKVPVVDRNEIIQTLTSDGPDEPFAKGVSFWRPDRRLDRPHAKIVERHVERRRENRISVVNDKPVWMWVGENLPELLRCPFGSRMIRHVEVQNPARADLHRHEHVEDLEGCGDRDEEIAGNDRLGVVSDEGRPTLISTSPARVISGQVFPDRPW